jgi:hypothetical protein
MCDIYQRHRKEEQEHTKDEYAALHFDAKAIAHCSASSSQGSIQAGYLISTRKLMSSSSDNAGLHP